MYFSRPVNYLFFLAQNKREHFNNNLIDGTIPAAERETDNFPDFVLPNAWLTFSTRLNESRDENNLSRDR
tara:strand:- start:2 stop:211 length:210 start_codon:yes stop_codon:yes gene_type:complete